MNVIAVLSSLILPALFVHLGLYGWRHAPVNRVTLRPSQWILVAGAAALPLILAVVVLVFRPWPYDQIKQVLVCVALMLVSIVYGISPSYREDRDSDVDKSTA